MITTTWLPDYQYVSFPFISFTIRLILHFHRSGKHGSFIFLHWCRQIPDVCMFFCDKCEVNAQTCSFPPSIGRKRCSLTPLRKGFEWLTLKAWPRRPCKMGKQTVKSSKIVGPQKKYMMKWAVFGVFVRFWKKPANVGVHPFQSIWDSIWDSISYLRPSEFSAIVTRFIPQVAFLGETRSRVLEDESRGANTPHVAGIWDFLLIHVAYWWCCVLR